MTTQLFWVTVEIDYLGNANCGEDQDGDPVTNPEYFEAGKRLTDALGPFATIATGGSSTDGREQRIGGRRGKDHLEVFRDIWERLQHVRDEFDVTNATVRISPWDQAARAYAPGPLPEGQELPEDAALIDGTWYTYQPRR